MNFTFVGSYVVLGSVGRSGGNDCIDHEITVDEGCAARRTRNNKS